jgi:hypothetical protein
VITPNSFTGPRASPRCGTGGFLSYMVDDCLPAEESVCIQLMEGVEKRVRKSVRTNWIS